MAPDSKSAGFRGPHSPRRLHLLLAAALFALFSLYGSLVPFTFQPTEFGEALSSFSRIGLFQWHRASRVDLVTNVLLFIPIGFFALGAWLVDRKSRWQTPVAMVAVGVACIALSAFNEFSQFWFPPRVPSASDIQANTLGTVVGQILWLLVGQRLVDWIRTVTASSRPQQGRVLFLTLYVVALVGYSMMPLDLTIHPEEILQKFKNGRVELIPFAQGSPANLEFWWRQLTTVLLSLPVGVWAARFRTAANAPPRSLWAGTLIGMCVVIGIECLQLFVNSRFPSATEALFGACGVTGGVWAVRRQSGMSLFATGAGDKPLAIRLTWGLSLMAYSLYLCSHFWWPMELLRNRQKVIERMGHFFNVPFSSMERQTLLEASTDVFQKLVLWSLLGILSAGLLGSLTSSRGRYRLLLIVALLYCMTLATGIELGQALFPPRVTDVTDVLLAALGGALGIGIAGWILGPRPDSTADECRKHWRTSFK